jgi:hypothetical protein
MDIKCDKHPRYTGKYTPRKPCSKCWRIFQTVNPMKAAEVLNSFEYDTTPWTGEVKYGHITEG